MSYRVRVLWEGEILFESGDFGDWYNTASAYFDSTVSLYRRSDLVSAGLTVQLLNGDDVEYETFVDGD